MIAKQLLLVVSILASRVPEFIVQVPAVKADYMFNVFDQFGGMGNVWLSRNANYMKSTCGTFKTYNQRAVENVNKRWYVMYISNNPSTTNYCSQFAKVQQPCKCLGIDFTVDVDESAVQFVMFSTNVKEMSVTYEIASTTLIGESFVLHSNANINGNGGYIVPAGAVVDSDNFISYMTLLFCAEGGKQPIIMILSNAFSMFDETKNKAYKYLRENGLNTNLIEVNHDKCKYFYPQNIVGFKRPAF